MMQVGGIDLRPMAKARAMACGSNPRALPDLRVCVAARPRHGTHCPPLVMSRIIRTDAVLSCWRCHSSMSKARVGVQDSRNPLPGWGPSWGTAEKKFRRPRLGGSSAKGMLLQVVPKSLGHCIVPNYYYYYYYY